MWGREGGSEEGGSEIGRKEEHASALQQKD